MKFTSISELTNNNIEIFGTKFFRKKRLQAIFLLIKQKGNTGNFHQDR